MGMCQITPQSAVRVSRKVAHPSERDSCKPTLHRFLDPLSLRRIDDGALFEVAFNWDNNLTICR